MNLNDYANEARKTARYPGAQYAERALAGSGLPAYALVGGAAVDCAVSALVAEAGEVAGKWAKCLRDHGGVLNPERHAAMVAEVGDVQRQIAALCDVLGVTLEGVARANLAKLADRAERGVIHGAGDER